MKAAILFFMLLIPAMLFISCNKNNNPTAPSGSSSSTSSGSTSSPVNGIWSVSVSSDSANVSQSLNASLNITVSGNTVSGNGSFKYNRDENNNPTSLSGTDAVTGTYTSPTINVKIGDNTDGFNFIGSWEKENSKFKGTATVMFSGTPYKMDCELSK